MLPLRVRALAPGQIGRKLAAFPGNFPLTIRVEMWSFDGGSRCFRMTGLTPTSGGELDGSGDWHIPSFTKITRVSDDASPEPEFVISNEASGRFFLANEGTVRFLSAIKDHGRVAVALGVSGLTAQQGGAIFKRLVENGLVVRRGETQAVAPKIKAPLDNRAIMIRWDMFDIERIAYRLRGLGRMAYAPLGYVLWLFVVGTAVFQLLSNTEKLRLTMSQVYSADWQQWFIFVGLFIGLKVFHELGHALAFREMMREEGHKTGPIRVGICVFAFTPFPFTDVTAAWRLRSRVRRVRIGAGGIYFETWVMAILTILWAQMQAGPFLTVAMQVAVVSGSLALLFNLNPAVKLDGYFMLTDWIRQPNLAARASLAARSFVARLMGAGLPAPKGFELAYWLASYLYRWTIFAGIFWILYQFDPRLAPIAAALVAMTLVIRPVMATFKFVRATDARPVRSGFVAAALATFVILLFVPFQNRLLLPGYVVRFDTRYVAVSETGRIVGTERKLTLQSPSLDHQIEDLKLHGELLENAKRASFRTASEQARINAELASNTEQVASLSFRQSTLNLGAARGIWTDLGAEALEGQWATSRDQEIAAISTPQAVHLLLDLDQTRITQDLDLKTGPDVAIRSHIAPDCVFAASVAPSSAEVFAVDGLLKLRANPAPGSDDCLSGLEHGAAIVARMPVPPSSMVGRIWLSLSRSLQDRLPIPSL